MRILLLLFLVLQFSVQLIAQEGTKPSDNNVAMSYGIVVDNSGSMRPYLDTLILTTKSIVRRNKAKDETFLVRFVNRDKIKRIQDLTQDPEKIVNASENFFSEGGQTAIIDAVFQSAEYLSGAAIKNDQDRRLALIVISDGEDRESKHKYDELVKMMVDKKITVYAIGFSKLLKKTQGKKVYETAVSLLQKVSADTGGRSFFPTTLVELNTSLDEIFASFRK